MSFATMATLALGGAALGAIANPEDREKGALMGLGAGLLAPVAAPMMGIGGAAGAGAGVTTTAAAAPVMTTGISGAGVAGMGAAPTVAAIPGAASAAAPVGIQSILPGAAINTSTGIAHTGTLGSKLGASKLGAMAGKAGDFIVAESPDVAKQVAVGTALSALSPRPKPQAPQARSSALPGQASPQGSLYERAAMNQQARMKKRQGARRFI